MVPHAANSSPKPDAGEPKGVSALCDIAGELSALLDEETRLLNAMQLQEIVPLQADKVRLTRLCGTALKSIDPKAPLAPGLKQRWERASKRLGDAAIANEMALRVGRAATDRLVAAIIGQVQNQRAPATVYGRPQAAQAARHRPASLSGVAVDRRL